MISVNIDSHSNSRIVIALLIFTLASCYCFLNLNSPSIQMADENVHVRATQSIMLGNWFAPKVADSYYLNKPPFKMWLTAIAVNLLGESNAAYRSIDALAGVATVLLVYWLGLAIFKSTLVGVIASLSLLGSHAFLFVHGARHGVQDSMLLLLSTLSLAFIWRALSRADIDNRDAAIAGIFSGLGVLTKSAAGLMPIIIGFVFSLCTFKNRNLKQVAWIWLWALGFCCLLVVSYFLPLFVFVPGAFSWVFHDQLVHRAIVGIEDQSNFLHYLEFLFMEGGFSNSLLLLCAVSLVLIQAIRLRCHNLVFLCCWSITPVFLYSLISTRFNWYIAPAYPALALCIGFLFKTIFDLEPLSQTLNLLKHVALTLMISVLLLRLWSTFTTVIEPKERIEMDLIVEQILNYRKLSGTEVQVPILRTKSHSFAQEEFPYYYMLGSSTKTIRSYKELKKLLHDKEPEFVFLPANRMYDLVLHPKIKAFAFLPSRRDRNNWHAVVSTINNLPNDLFIPVVDSQAGKALQPQNKAESGVTFQLQGNWAYHRLTTRLSLKITGKPGAVSLNDKELSPLDGKTEYLISANTWQPEKNLLKVSGTGISVEQIVVELVQEKPNPYN